VSLFLRSRNKLACVFEWEDSSPGMAGSHRIIVLALLFAASLTVLNLAQLPSLQAVTGERNIVVNPGFEYPSCPAWMNTGTIGGGL